MLISRVKLPLQLLKNCFLNLHLILYMMKLKLKVWGYKAVPRSLKILLLSRSWSILQTWSSMCVWMNVCNVTLRWSFSWGCWVITGGSTEPSALSKPCIILPLLISWKIVCKHCSYKCACGSLSCLFYDWKFCKFMILIMSVLLQRGIFFRHKLCMKDKFWAAVLLFPSEWTGHIFTSITARTVTNITFTMFDQWMYLYLYLRAFFCSLIVVRRCVLVTVKLTCYFS